jgi:hypothetical protein
MGAELPALSAVIARLPDPKIHLAAYGGVVFPLALIIESPIIMLLAASTALSKDMPSYRLIRSYMMWAGAALTGLHILVAFTPLYYLVAEGILGAPAEIVEPARVGLMIMTPWTWSIAYRRFNQGVLIRNGYSRAVGTGTVIRLAADLIVLGGGLIVGTVPGIVVATTAVIAGVLSEAVYAGWRVRPVLRSEVAAAPIVQPPLTWSAFGRFYVPLVMTSLLTLLAQPIGSAALSRMPVALSSLAVWPVVSGLVFMTRGLGLAFNEVVVALLERPGSVAPLRRFASVLAVVTTVGLLAIAATPLSYLWFRGLSALPVDLAVMARSALWLALPLPALSAAQSWYQGALLHASRTRAITESVVLYMATMVLVLGAGVAYGQMIGLYVGVVALVLSTATQTGWLAVRARPLIAGWS